jgi:hypothetical protein
VKSLLCCCHFVTSYLVVQGWAIVAFNMEGVLEPSSMDAVLAETHTYCFERRTRQFR